MIKRLIIFLIRTRLGLKKLQPFKFDGQKTDNVYWFTSDDILKYDAESMRVTSSSVSLHWLIDDKCTIRKIY